MAGEEVERGSWDAGIGRRFRSVGIDKRLRDIRIPLSGLALSIIGAPIAAGTVS